MSEQQAHIRRPDGERAHISHRLLSDGRMSACRVFAVPLPNTHRAGGCPGTSQGSLKAAPMSADFNSRRMALARRRRGLTKAALAADVGVSLRAITAFEREEVKPSAQTIARIAARLAFPVEFFSGPDLDEPPLEGSSFRALSNLTARERHQSLAAGAIALALSDWIDARFTLPNPDVPRLQGLDPETAAAVVRTEWGLGERPITNIIHVLEAHGVRVFSLAEDCNKMDAYSFWRAEVPYVFLNTMKSAEHSRMDAAHELGHLALHWRPGVRSKPAEYEADLFGSAFLMPQGSLIASAPRPAALPQIVDAKRAWGVSAAALAYRMHRLKLISDWQYRALFVAMSREGYRTQEPNGMPPEMSQVLAKVFAALKEEGVPRAQVAEELCIYPDELDRLIFKLTLTAVPGALAPWESSA